MMYWFRKNWFYFIPLAAILITPWLIGLSTMYVKWVLTLTGILEVPQ